MSSGRRCTRLPPTTMGPTWMRLALGAIAIGGSVGLYVWGKRRPEDGGHGIRGVCPRCKEDLQLRDGVNRCPRCDLRIKADVGG